MILLQNKTLQLHIEPPQTGYISSRFDWTGKIVQVRFQGHSVTGVERLEWEALPIGGKGLFNEFGMNKPVGFEETAIGGWFHKIGVGLLKKEEASYLFDKNYLVQPASFTVEAGPHKLTITCQSEAIHGYAYRLIKEIELFENHFRILYKLHNTGEKPIITDEYTHNFLTIDHELIGPDYQLAFPFEIKPATFGETVNPEGLVQVGQNGFAFEGTPEEQFFFSNLSGSSKVTASWELLNHKSKIGIRETGSFPTQLVNLWGWKHVISPELFFVVNVGGGEVCEWERRYEVFRSEDPSHRLL